MTVSFYENLTIGLYHVNWTNMGISKQVFKEKKFYLIILFIKTFKSSFKTVRNRIKGLILRIGLNNRPLLKTYDTRLYIEKSN